jgi:CelD/BcsL family acetyltransferase involved in cellulose biosynthesis
VTGSNNSYSIDSGTIDDMLIHRQQMQEDLPWNCLFVLPSWLKVWWKNFGRESQLKVLSIRRAGRLIGIAPLQVKEDRARLIGDREVCDHLDFVVAPENAAEFYRILLTHLKRNGISRLELEPIRPDSSAFAILMPLAEEMGCPVSRTGIDVSFEMHLPGSWEEYLATLTGKERHEIRRKLRRLEEAGRIRGRLVDELSAVPNEMEVFLELFKSNRSDKAGFMTGRMATYFRDLAQALAAARILKLFFLDLDDRPVAAAMCFNFQSTMFLYNNGYDHSYRNLSVGLLSKVLSIRESIQSGLRTYDFLKGAEAYKQRLGGRPIQLYRGEIDLNPN